MTIQLLINTGGEGKRLYPLTKNIPKPLIMVKGKPILHHMVDWAKKYEVSEIIMLNGYKSERIVEYFGKGERFNMPIKHSIEPYPLGSGGPIRLASKHITGRFAYISGDLICDVNLKNLLDFHLKNNADITIVVQETDHSDDSDLLQLNEENRVIKFISKHENHEGIPSLANMGLCILEPGIIKLMDRESFNFENYLYPKILSSNLKMMAYKTNERIYDIGTQERLKRIEESDFEGIK